MQRNITEQLLKWKTAPGRKPLILNGARQVGKTYIVRDLAKNHYDNLIEINFDQASDAKSVFEATKDPSRILEQLSVAYSTKITPGRTLIFFDEIQECPEALNSLKYFYEEAPDQHVIAAGSLLGIRLAHTSFPVGKVNFLDLHPMSFYEFLKADGESMQVDYLNGLSNIEPISDLLATKLTEKMKIYFLVGGMPEAVTTWLTTKDINATRATQSDILAAYERDFSKHVSESEANRISQIWHSISAQLSRENKKFVFQVIREGARAREYEGALNWLRDAGLVEKILCTKEPKLPLMGYADLTAFRLYLLDTGLLSNIVDLPSSTILQGDALFTEYEGALTENYVLQCLRASGAKQLFYHTFDRYKNDFLLQNDGRIYPIEVKSGSNTPHRSLTVYMDKYHPNLALRFSPNNLALDGDILNIPLYMAESWRNLVSAK